MRRAIIAVVAAVVLAGCADTPEDKKVEVGGKSSEPTPTPTATKSSTGTLLDLVPPEPQRPADARTKAGAIAFSDYVFKSIYYAYGTADPTPITDIADTAICSGCKTPVNNATTAGDNGRLLLGTQPVTTSDAKVTNVDGDIATVRLTVDYPQMVLVVADTKQAEGDRIKAVTEPTTVNLRWQGGKWVLLDFQPVKKK